MRIRKRGKKNDTPGTVAGKQSIDADITQLEAGARERVGVPWLTSFRKLSAYSLLVLGLDMQPSFIRAGPGFRASQSDLC
ncbi:hypothetical protein [Bradyrhizobium sp. CCBAU 53421]|uniref:hypothetical protein n=1 Tax=Bradyrhizobium sp. CCBAU 53421 TaxID=1325120 RepID=UPI001FEDCF7C|nr:hypothetical protein [Bradyrhizobium sp. CCBAU 53421]